MNKFRFQNTAFVAEEKAFLMIGTNKRDRDMPRFLWFANTSDPDPELRFCWLVFGLRPSPAILGATIEHHLATYKGNRVEPADTVECLQNFLYADDFISGAETEEDAIKLYKDAKEIMPAGDLIYVNGSLTQKHKCNLSITLKLHVQRKQKTNQLL